jgi:GldM N-terminal domain
MKNLLLLSTFCLLFVSCDNNSISIEEFEVSSITNMQLIGRFDTHNELLIKELDNKIEGLSDSSEEKRFHNLTNEHYNYLESIIDTLTSMSKVDNIIDSKNYKELSSVIFSNELFFTSDGYTKYGETFIAKTNHYKKSILLLSNEPELKTIIHQLIKNTVTNYYGDEIFLDYYFKDISLIGVITHLKSIQNIALMIELGYLNNKTTGNKELS